MPKTLCLWLITASFLTTHTAQAEEPQLITATPQELGASHGSQLNPEEPSMDLCLFPSRPDASNNGMLLLPYSPNIRSAAPATPQQ